MILRFRTADSDLDLRVWLYFNLNSLVYTHSIVRVCSMQLETGTPLRLVVQLEQTAAWPVRVLVPVLRFSQH